MYGAEPDPSRKPNVLPRARASRAAARKESYRARISWSSAAASASCAVTVSRLVAIPGAKRRRASSRLRRAAEAACSASRSAATEASRPASARAISWWIRSWTFRCSWRDWPRRQRAAFPPGGDAPARPERDREGGAGAGRSRERPAWPRSREARRALAWLRGSPPPGRTPRRGRAGSVRRVRRAHRRAVRWFSTKYDWPPVSMKVSSYGTMFIQSTVAASGIVSRRPGLKRESDGL